MDETERSRLDDVPADEAKARLRSAFPGWQVWYVPAWDGRRSTMTWCARPEPLLNCASAAELVEEMLRHSSSTPRGSREARD